MKCISLLTDFGLQDAFVGVMKGVIFGIAPDVRIVDLSHQIAPQNILQGAIILTDSYRYFPSGSIHLAVVDPGVGTKRAGLAAQIGAHTFVAPDNGILTCVIEQAEQIGEPIYSVRLENRQYWLPHTSRTFHGRDIFAPVAAHLANGVSLDSFGSSLEQPVRIDIPRAARTPGGWRAEVLMIDAFGNLITNLKADQLAGMFIHEARVGGAVIRQLANTFGEAEPGALIALIDSSQRLSIGLVNGSAAEKLGAKVGDQVEVALRQAELE